MHLPHTGCRSRFLTVRSWTCYQLKWIPHVTSYMIALMDEKIFQSTMNQKITGILLLRFGHVSCLTTHAVLWALLTARLPCQLLENIFLILNPYILIILYTNVFNMFALKDVSSSHTGCWSRYLTVRSWTCYKLKWIPHVTAYYSH